jgi:hypothetical protein
MRAVQTRLPENNKMKIQAWKCPYTGNLFELEDRAKYVACRRKGRKAFLAQQEKEKIRDTWKEWLRAEKLKITRPEQIVDWFLTNQKTIMAAYNAIDGWHRHFDDKFVPEDNFSKLEFTRLTFSETVSNSHSCPEDGVRNFMCEPDKPRGYIGWTGYLNGSLDRPAKHNASYPYSGALQLVGIHTGSGGGGNKSFSYDFKIFLGDWPGLQAEVDRILNQKRLDAIRARRKAAVAKVRNERNEIVRRLQNAGSGSRR